MRQKALNGVSEIDPMKNPNRAEIVGLLPRQTVLKCLLAWEKIPALFLVAGLLSTNLNAAGINFSFYLSGPQKTSAGVYSTDAAPVLVRTLWSGESKSAGNHSAAWDGNKDDGSPAPAGDYTIKVRANGVTHTWLGGDWKHFQRFHHHFQQYLAVFGRFS